MKRGFHSLCLRRNGTKLELAVKHGKVASCTQPMSAFDPGNMHFLSQLEVG